MHNQDEDTQDVHALEEQALAEEALAEEADRRGLTVQQLKVFKEMKAEAEVAQKAKEAQAFILWTQQGELCKQNYPSFNFLAECQNSQTGKRFLDLLKGGVEVQTAYEIIHKDEIVRTNTEAANEKARNRLGLNILLALLCAFLLAWIVYGGNKTDATNSQPKAISKATLAPSATTKPTAAPTAKKNSTVDGILVWIPRTGQRYHDSARCSGMKNPSQVTIGEAKERGYTPCGNCKPPR